MTLPDTLHDPLVVAILGGTVAILFGAIIIGIYNRAHERRRRMQPIQSELIGIQFGGGVVSVGKFDVRLFNKTKEAIHNVTFTISILDRFRRKSFRRSNWIVYDDGKRKTWEFIAPNQVVTYELNTFHLEEFLKKHSLAANFETPEFNRNLYHFPYPSRICLHFTLTFTLVSGEKHMVVYYLTPFPEIHTPESLYGEHYKTSWQFDRLR